MSDFNFNSPETKLPAIPGLEGVTDQQTKRVLLAIKESIEVLTAKRPRSNKLDSAVTFRDLHRYNLAKFRVNGRQVSNANPDTSVSGATAQSGTTFTDTIKPTAPTGLQATGTKLSVILEWQAPRTDISHTEIYRANDDDIGNAVLVGTTQASLYADILNEAGLTRYYWIKFVSKGGVASNFNQISGTQAITGQITSNELLSLDGAKIIDATIVNAKIADLSADKITTGNLSATTSVSIGDAQNRWFILGNGIIRSGGALDYLNGSGVWMGTVGGITRFSFGNSINYVAWDGYQVLINSDNLKLTNNSLIFNGSGTFNGDGHFTGSLNVNNNFIVDADGNATLNSASVKGAIYADSGYFGGQLLAGVLDFATLAGITYQYFVPGTYYVTIPADKTSLRISLLGGSGAGGFSGWHNNEYNASGGGGGGSNWVVLTVNNVTPGHVLRVVVGSKGLAQWGPIAGTRRGKSGGSGGVSEVYDQDLSQLLFRADGGVGGQGGNSDVAGGSGGAGANGAGSGANGSLRNVVPNTGFGGGFIVTAASPAMGGESTNGGNRGGNSGQGAIDINPPSNLAQTYAQDGQDGKAIVEFFNPNSVVIKTEYDTLLSALARQGIQTS